MSKVNNTVFIAIVILAAVALICFYGGYQEGHAKGFTKGMKNMSAIMAETVCETDLNGDGHVSKAYVSDEETYYIHCEAGFIYAERK